MPDTPLASSQLLCSSADLANGGPGHVFDLLEYGRPARAFVVRHQDRVVGYLNRCAHVPVELDWQPGRFFDDEGRWLICAIHGAVYDPATGHCIAGPCIHKRLQAVQVEERDGQVYWYPSPQLKPASTPDRTPDRAP